MKVERDGIFSTKKKVSFRADEYYHLREMVLAGYEALMDKAEQENLMPCGKCDLIAGQIREIEESDLR